MSLKCLVFIYLLCELCSAYKVLVIFPLPGKSHSILGEGYVRHLVNAGHEVTYLTAIPAKMKSENLRHILLESNFKYFPEDEFLDISKILTNENEMASLRTILEVMYTLANATVNHPNVQNLMNNLDEKFDLVIAEWMYNELYAGIAAVFKCPLIWSSSVNPHPLVLALIDEAPNPAYAADLVQSDAVPPFTFWERCQELWTQIYTQYLLWQLRAGDNQVYIDAFTPPFQKRGQALPPYEEVKYNASLILGNSHVSTGEAIRLPINHINIGGYHIDETVKPLPKDLQEIMDNGKNGVIYFSMGSMLKSRSMPNELKKRLLDMFSQLKQTVLWKFEEDLPNLPKNVHILKWAPQQSILAHPNCVLFITHGGLLSTTEALHFGVPIIGIPMFADQALNVKRAQSKGFAIKVTFDNEVPDNLKAAITEILGNPKYRERVTELSFVHHHRPVSPSTELLHWVDHVVKTRGAPHLRSPALMMPWYQKYYLDLVAIILVVLLAVIRLIKMILCSSNNKSAIGSKKFN
ncbi:unnamed protein product [Colias eurytheme]|nr:unnamed protein product [Colias eurytheme]